MRSVSRIAALMLAALAGSACAEPAPLMLGVAQLLAWDARGPLAEPRNRSRVSLAARIVDPDAPGDPRVRVLYAPDGMDRLGGAIAPRAIANGYVFTHWAQIDILNWFAGSADRAVAIPARPWIDAAHRNGVKVIGTLFVAPVAFGGSAAEVEALVRQTPDGRFPAADRLVAIARYYGFDGWLVNQETDLLEVSRDGRAERDPARAPQAARIARKMRDFMAYLTRIRPQGMEIHWYDAMLEDGSVRWQNALTDRNLGFLERGGRVADAMFLNYDWSPAGLRSGAALAERAGRSRYEVFIGADLWPARRSGQAAFHDAGWIRALRPDPARPALGSLALFAPHFNYSFPGDARTARFSRFDSDPRDAARFHDVETRLFAGDDRNLAMADPAPGWPGIGWLVPARSPLTRLPFRTAFNIGHGRHDFVRGAAGGGGWTDLARQDVLPSYQFAHAGTSGTRAAYDFARAWRGGSSLRITVPAGGGAGEMPLYLSDAALGPRTGVAVAALGTGDRRFALRLHFAGGGSESVVLPAVGRWREQRWCLANPPGRRLTRISVAVAAALRGRGAAALNLGELTLDPRCG